MPILIHHRINWTLKTHSIRIIFDNQQIRILIRRSILEHNIQGSYLVSYFLNKWNVGAEARGSKAERKEEETFEVNLQASVLEHDRHFREVFWWVKWVVGCDFRGSYK